GFAFAETSLRVIEEYHLAAHALDADFEGDTRAERRLLKNQREEFAAQSFRVTSRIGFDVRGEREEFARVRRTPFGSSEEIICLLNRYRQCRRCHFHLAADMAAGNKAFDCEDSVAGTTRGVLERTVSKRRRNSRTCALVIR